MRLTPDERQSYAAWEEFRLNMERATPAETGMTEADKKKKLKHLEANPIEWIIYFFPEFAKYEFADFHIRAIKRCTTHMEWMEVLSWARSLAKSTVVMFIVLYLVLTGKKRNVIMASATVDAAKRLLAPYKKQLETNARLKAYYGNQVTLGKWSEEEFILKNGASFRAIGAGSAPRGSRNDMDRPDVHLLDDFDTDEICRNPDRLDAQWKWWEEALYGTRDIAVKLLVIFCGNIIAKDCCIVRAGKIANSWDIVNVRDANGISTWPQKNTEEMIDAALSKTSTAAVQKEYYNNPVSEGKIFKNLIRGKVPPLRKFKFLVIYGDPSPGESKKKQASFKAVWLMGKLQSKLYIIKGRLFRGSNEEFIEAFFDLHDFVGGKTNVYSYVENNKLQDPFFKQVLKRHLNRLKKRMGVQLSIIPDEDKKTDKATRIEANLEPLDREGELVFNEEMEDSLDMKELLDQFKLFDMTLSYPADGPDCIEGGNRVIDNKTASMEKTYTQSRASLRMYNKYRR